MSDEIVNEVRQVACDYISRETKYANCTVVSIDKSVDRKHNGEQCYSVMLVTSFSPEQIEEFIANADPKYVDDVRLIIKGDFVYKLIIAGDVIVSKEWENMDIS